MGALTEGVFSERLELGCARCGGRKYVIKTFVEGVFPLFDGESDGTVVWGYKGETFVDGVFDVRCAACAAEVFADHVCPRCHAPGGLARALGECSSLEVMKACPRCEDDTVSVRAFVPITVTYEGRRVSKPRAGAELEEPAFHGVRLDCSACGLLADVGDCCPLCQAQGPIRQQPR